MPGPVLGGVMAIHGVPDVFRLAEAENLPWRLLQTPRLSRSRASITNWWARELSSFSLDN